jgi:hypothetical protein
METSAVIDGKHRMNNKLHPLVVVAILVGLIGILALLFKSLLAATACVVSILLAASFFWGLGRLEAWYRRRRAVAGKLKNSLELQRLLKPDWVFYEQHLSREIPKQFGGFIRIRSSSRVSVFHSQERRTNGP